ncbi:MAG: hypothetical protein ACRBC3_08200 [Burkholderiaceae bacterium]
MKLREPPKTAIAHLEGNEAYQAVADRVDLLRRTQQILDAHWARLGLTVLAVRHEGLLIGTVNAAVAAKCRQMEPSMIDRLKPLLPGLVQIKFRPQAKKAPTNAAPASRKQLISAAALADMNAAVANMPEGTGRQALLRLLQRRRQ